MLKLPSPLETLKHGAAEVSVADGAEPGLPERNQAPSAQDFLKVGRSIDAVGIDARRGFHVIRHGPHPFLSSHSSQSSQCPG